MTSDRSIFLVGTDTHVGKTALTCALMTWARRHGVRALPFKPVQSGADPDDLDSDAHRLARAAGLDPSRAAAVCPRTYPDPVAPGIAEDPTPFLLPSSANSPPDPPQLRETTAALDRLRAEFAPQLVFIEGAGGLHVPMPGGTWLPQWITHLATDVVIVGRLGLGTINHTLGTVDALRGLGVSPLGFYLVATAPDDADPSTTLNPQVIAAARNLPHLGTLAYQLDDPDGPGRVDLLRPLISLLP